MTGLLFVHVAIIPREQCADFLVRQNCVNQRAHDLLDVYELPGRRDVQVAESVEASTSTSSSLCTRAQAEEKL